MGISMVTQFAQLTDMEVISKVLEGEAALYEIIIRRYNPYLYKVGRSYGYSHDDVQDLMQETFVSTYLNLRNFENRSTFKTWIVRIMLNNCYQKKQKFSFKNEMVNGEFTDDAIVPMFSSSMESNPGKAMVNRELGVVLEKAITTLPIEYRMVFSLREVNGMSTAETAESLEITESNVKVRLNRAKKMLRGEIEKMYAAEEIFEFNLIYCDPMVVRVMGHIERLVIDKPPR